MPIGQLYCLQQDHRNSELNAYAYVLPPCPAERSWHREEAPGDPCKFLQAPRARPAFLEFPESSSGIQIFPGIMQAQGLPSGQHTTWKALLFIADAIRRK